MAVLTFEELLGGLGAVDLVGDVEEDGQRAEEDGEEYDGYDVHVVTRTQQLLRPQQARVVHLDTGARRDMDTFKTLIVEYDN